MNERQNKPSASAIERIASCPASLRLSLANATDYDLVVKNNEDVRHGDDMHFCLEHGTFPEKVEDREVLDWVVRKRDELVKATFSGKQVTELKELRFWAKDMSFSGKPDYVCLSKDRTTALIIDYKFGHLETSVASSNLQLASLAVLLKQAYPAIKLVRCAILQPYVTRNVEVCRYTETDLTSTEKYIAKTLEIANRPDSECRPSEKACRHCPALSYCPAVALTMQKVSPLVEVDKAWVYWTADQKKKAYDVAQLAKRFVARIEANVKADLENGKDVSGLELTVGKTVTKVTNPQGVFKVLNERFPHDVTASAFVGCCKVSLPEVTKIVHKAMNKDGAKVSIKGCRDEIELMVQKFITQSRSAPTIKSSNGKGSVDVM